MSGLFNWRELFEAFDPNTLDRDLFVHAEQERYYLDAEQQAELNALFAESIEEMKPDEALIY